MPIGFRSRLSSGLLFKRVLSLSGPLHPLRCFEILSLGRGIKRSKSEKHWAPRTWKPWVSKHKADHPESRPRGRPALLQKDQTESPSVLGGSPRPDQRQQPFVRAFVLSSKAKRTPPSLLYKPAHLKGPVSHGFQIIEERRHGFF